VDAVIAASLSMATTSSEDASVLVDGLAAFDAMIQAETDLLRACIELEIGTLRLATATNDTPITTSEARVEVD
jgi:hypothetical protein